MRDRVTITKYSYHGPFGEVSHSGRAYFAWGGGHLIGTYRTFEKAMEHLACKERLKTGITFKKREQRINAEGTRETGS
jgi:hypothetical protein